MQSLPYELLQQISSYLLPRYQCRLTLCSRHHYKYLYNDLLRWHVRKQYIPTPACEIITFLDNTLYSIIISNNIVRLMGIYYQHFNVYNLTTLMRHAIWEDNKSHIFKTNARTFYYNTKLHYKILHTMQCYKYVHREYLLTMLNSVQPVVLLTSSKIICGRITRMLDDQDLKAICQCRHLSFIFMP